MIPGDGAGQELMSSVKDVFSAAHVPVDFEEIFVSEVQKEKSASLETLLDSCRRNKVCIKGVITSPMQYRADQLMTLNMRIRKALDLHANVVHIKSLDGLDAKQGKLDLVLVRESTEGEYSALEHEAVPGIVESLKITTRQNSARIARFAFQYAVQHGRKKVTAVHKANIMKMGDGLFLNTCAEVAKSYPNVEFEGLIVDNTCMQLVSKPEQFDVMVMPNLYGNIIANLAAGLIGGAGIVAGQSHSTDVAVFEPGARQAFAELAGKNQANPTAILLCSANMLDHMGLEKHSSVIRKAVLNVVASGKFRTVDVGGTSSTSEFVGAVIDNLSLAE